MIDQILQGLMYPFLFLSMYFQVLLLISFFENAKKIEEEEDFEVETYPSVTIAVPCWNEEKTLEGTLLSLLDLEYPKDKLSIVVVDDGSKDKTLQIGQEYARLYPKQIHIISKQNGGKHTAVNVALEYSKSDFFGCLDADSFVHKNALKTIIAYFIHHKNAMAVTPCIHIMSPKTIIQRVQAVEYLMGVFLRKAFGQLDAIQVTPGPFSIFRKEVFDIIGNYKKAHNTEDYEITLRMHKHHLKIMNSHKALVYTVGPSTFKGYFFQRLRWSRGFLENSLDYKELFFKKKYGNFGMFTLPMAFLFVFYGIYVAFFVTYTFIKHYTQVISQWMLVGIHPGLPTFDIFYFNTTIVSFVGMVMFTMFLFTIYIGKTLSDDKQELYRNFPFFFFIYPLFGLILFPKAVFDTFTHRKNEWVLQDTKK
ncbi:MAG: glycosyltransferase family 2 protein [Candidatus Pacebacteria bacterium]|nr:glycosyltransferase family 2 protein [Candidatus Paceibacterota bacterium]MBP9866498.1 glycosyltransferase family 2 protein [Candidatus Paceibacterota bacterium]